MTATGQIGVEAEKFVQEIHSLSGGKIGGVDLPSYAVPNCSKYWHRRLRLVVLMGMATILSLVSGGVELDFDQSSEFCLEEGVVGVECSRLQAVVDLRCAH